MKRKGFQDPPKRFRGAPQPARKPRPKKPLNVSVDAEILKVAKEMNINLSKAMDDALHRLTEAERARRFQEENGKFFESYNAYIERNGVFGEELLDFDDDPPI